MEMEKSEERWVVLQDLGTNCPPEELDRDVELITEAMQNATKEMAKEKKPSERARPWWSEALNEANKRRMT